MTTAAYRIGISTGGTGKSPEQSRWENGSFDSLESFRTGTTMLQRCLSLMTLLEDASNQ